jgi:hypothetical protein
MAYELNAFIGRAPLFSGLDASPAKKVALRQGMTLVPLTDTLRDWVQEHYKGEVPGFERLSAPVYSRWRILLGLVRKESKALDGRVLGFELLSVPIFQLGLELSQRGAVAYVEASFFGNHGGQDAIVWEHGSVLMAPVHSCDGRACSPASEPRRTAPDAPPCFPINEALRRLGVEKNGEVDEFDAVQLGRHRNTENWANAT